jgi:hypothetical protein
VLLAEWSVQLIAVLGPQDAAIEEVRVTGLCWRSQWGYR